MTPEIQNAIEHVYDIGIMVGLLAGIAIGLTVGVILGAAAVHKGWIAIKESS